MMSEPDSGAPVPSVPVTGSAGPATSFKEATWPVRAVRIAAVGYRAIGLTLLIAGWLGELAIIVARNFVNLEPAWTVESVTLALMYGTLLYVAAAKRHVGFQLLARYMDSRGRALGMVVPVLSLAIGVLFTYEATRAVIEAHHEGGTTGTGGLDYPLWLIYLVAPIFGGVLSLMLLIEIVAIARRRSR
jgi:TRAP-type C4-dicarboxylate transport system permease small subunit